MFTVLGGVFSVVETMGEIRKREKASEIKKTSVHLIDIKVYNSIVIINRIYDNGRGDFTMKLTMSKWARSLRSNLGDFLKELKTACLAAGRRPDDVKVVYATKYLNPEQFVTFIRIGKEIDILPVTIGENRVQEAEEKIQRLKDTKKESVGNFHPVMIGTLQKNKINKAIKLFEEIHSVDSLELAETMNNRLRTYFKTFSLIPFQTGPAACHSIGTPGKRCVPIERLARVTRFSGFERSSKREKVMPIFLEVNVSEEKTKHGFKVEGIEGVIREIRKLSKLEIRGLMTMAPMVSDPEQVRPIFRRLKQIAGRHNLLTSMGMSNDWKAAVEEGADMIRIGSRIFTS